MISSSRLATAAASAIAAIFLIAHAQPAAAQGLADMQRVIKQQQGMIAAQAKTLEALKRQVDALQAKADSNAKGVAANKMAGGAATTVTSGNARVKLAISGQINRALLLTDDGNQSDLFQVDNDSSATRVRFVGTAQASDDLTIGATMEVQMKSNASADVSQATENAAVGGTSFTERVLEIAFESEKYGTLTLGQGETASDGATEVDLSGTDLVTSASVADMAGGMLFRNSTTNALSSVTIADVTDSMSGRSRQDRIRYDTPEFQGLQLAVSAEQGNAVDGAVFYAAKYGETEVAAGFHVSNQSSISTTVDTQYGGSAAVLLANGISVMLSAAVQDLKTVGRNNPSNVYAKLGYQAKWLDSGTTALSIDWGQTEDLAADGDEFTTVGLGLVQNVDAWGTEFYAGIRNYKLDRTGTNFDDILAGMAGARVKF